MAVIHPEHAGLVRQMLLAGKHVLVEKPAVTRVADWDAPGGARPRTGLLLLEAMKVMCFPPCAPVAAPAPAAAAARAAGGVRFDPAQKVGKLFRSGAGWRRCLGRGVYPSGSMPPCHRLGLGCPALEVTLTRAPGRWISPPASRSMSRFGPNSGPPSSRISSGKRPCPGRVAPGHRGQVVESPAYLLARGLPPVIWPADIYPPVEGRDAARGGSLRRLPAPPAAGLSLGAPGRDPAGARLD